MRKLALALLSVAALALPVVPVHAATGAASTGMNQSTGGPNAAPQPFKTTNLTAAAAAEPVITNCSGYFTLASISSSGHRLSTKGQICGAFHGISGDKYGWGPVARFKCYRDDVPFGSGTGGCRWKGSVSNYLDRFGSKYHVHSDAFQKPPSSDGTFWADSGRIYGEPAGYLANQRIKMCEDDWIYDNGQGAIGNGAVHFRGITGIDYGTFNMADWCTGWFLAAVG
jgi:hypothetical protein